MSDLKVCANSAGTGIVTLKSPDTNTDRTIFLPDRDTTLGVTAAQEAVLDRLSYDPAEDQLVASVAIETTLNSLYLGGQHKMSSGAENVYFTNLTSDINFYPAWGGLKDQSIVANQGSSGYIAPSGRVFTDMFSLPLGGSPVSGTAVPYDGDNYFGINISGVGITTVAAETVPPTVKLQYRIVVDGTRVYSQTLPRVSNARSTAGNTVYSGDTIDWFFDHPVDIVAGTTLTATIMKIRIADDVELGAFLVQQGDTVDPNTGLLRYQATVSNRLFQDHDLEFSAYYFKSQAMDFGLDPTGSTVLLRDLTKASTERVLKSYPINLLEASANGSTIRIKIKDGAKVIIDSLPVAGASINGTLVNSVLNQAVIALNSIFTNTAGFLSTDTFVNSFLLSGNNLVLGLNDGVSYTVDVTSLGVDENKFVSSGALSGSNLNLTMSDGSIVTIDASNMVNGSTGLATSSGWFISYGTNANDAVGTSTNDSTINTQLPLYFGEALPKGSEFKWNFQSHGGANLIMGIWDGPEVATAYNGGSITASNWGTMFIYAGGFTAGSNSTLLTTNSGAKYVVSNGDAMGIRFGNDGHLTLIDYSGATPVEVAKTTIPLAVTSFNMQMHTWANGVLPNGIINNVDYIWDIVHDFAGTEAGIINGILDHTVLKSAMSIVKGEKLLFMLDEVGQGDFFGTDYTNASTGVSTAEEQLDNTFMYQTNEAIVFDTSSGVSDWIANTNAPDYFYAASLHQYRDGGSGTIQGLFSLRFNDDGKLTIYDEDAGVKIATAKANPTVGSSVHLYFGVKGNRAYYSIPVITKQTIGQGSQPDVNFNPTVANQTVTITEANVLNFQIITSDNIVNQFVELDAPSWMTINQVSGVLSGTAPAHTGTSADTIVVNCKAGNAIGGTVAFTVTVTVAQAAYTNSLSLNFNGTSSWLQGDPLNITALDRVTNGDGNAWSISMWVKPTGTTSTQTLLVYGFGNDYSGGAITLKQSGGTSLVLNYGTVYNNIITVGSNAFNTNAWNHILVTFDGGTTGSVGSEASLYYSRFKLYANGVQLSTVSVASGNGFDAVLNGSNASDNIFRIGRASNVHNNYFDGIINQVGIWNSDQTANLATIYNSGATQDLTGLSAAPSHAYELGGSATSVSDEVGSATLTGYNFVSGDLVSDSP
mgnify:CR=1 FL=1